jgi:hypothetical protein
MATEPKTAQQGEQEAEERAKRDAEMLDKTLKCLDSISKRMDAFEAKMDAAEEKEKEEKAEKEKADAVGGDNPETVYKAATDRTRYDNAVAQERADSICNAWGTQAPRPLDGESTRDYKVCLMRKFKQNSPTWRNVDMAQIARLPAEVFDRAEAQIYTDSLAASAHPVVPDGELLTVTRRMSGDPTGRMETVHFGRPSVRAPALARAHQSPSE